MTLEELKYEKMQDMKMDAIEEELLSSDYDYAYEKLVTESYCLDKINECLVSIASEMRLHGWEITDKEILEDIL